MSAFHAPTVNGGERLTRARAPILASPRPVTREAISNVESRNELIVEYLPLVRFVANRIASRLPNHVEVDDLVEAGVIGLIDALEKFDPSQEIKFKTYAEFRIRGAILDELRALDWAPRSTRQKSARVEKAFSELEQELGRPPNDTELMERLGVAPEEFDALIQEARGVALVSLDELRGDSDDGFERSLLESITDPDGVDVSEEATLKQSYRNLVDTIDVLPEKERLVVALYYYEELTMKEIGDILNVTESRVSQIHTKAIQRLKARLQKTFEQ